MSSFAPSQGKLSELEREKQAMAAELARLKAELQFQQQQTQNQLSAYPADQALPTNVALSYGDPPPFVQQGST